MDVNQYLEIFIEETKEHLQVLNQSLLTLEQNIDDYSTLDEIFRSAHTLKGMSATMGFNKMSHLTHEMENVLQAIRNKDIYADTGIVDLLFKSLDALDNYLNNIIDKNEEGNNDYAHITDALNKLININNASSFSELDNISSVEQLNQYEQNVINKAKELEMNVYTINITLSEGCVLKSARTFIIFKTLEKYSEIIKSEPTVEDLEDEKFDLEFSVTVITNHDKEILLKELNTISEIEKVLIHSVDSFSTPCIKSANKDLNKVSTSPSTNNNINVTDISNERNDNEIKKAKTSKSVRVDIGRLDVLLNLVSELIIQKTRLEGLNIGERNPVFNEIVEYLERISTNLHDAVMKVRMVPVETVFNRFPRMIRDMSKELNKEVQLVMSGEETELDRSVIDEIGDPLIHLLRNSLDHGIEVLEKRREVGKSDTGKINLSAYQDGSSVVIEVSDDGQGIDLEKVKRKAIERGLINKESANNLSQKEIINFMFEPSFSTADKVTDISGRGVGLDVVKTKIESLGGIVDVETEYGKGSRFIVRLPLTLAIIKALLVMVGNEKYAIQLSSISQIVNILPEEIKYVQDQEVIILRNKLIPIIRLNKVLDVKTESKTKKKLTIVIVKKGEKLSGLLVDNVVGQQEIVQKSLGKYLSDIKVITSATILGDGDVALILDVNSLI